MQSLLLLLLVAAVALPVATAHAPRDVFDGACPVPDNWLCDPVQYSRGDGVCDCGCGVFDPDCAEAGAFIANCPRGKFCNYKGECEQCHNVLATHNDEPQGTYTRLTTALYGVCHADCNKQHRGWFCDHGGAPSDFDAHTDNPTNSQLWNRGDGHCDCGRGKLDPDCREAGAWVTGCPLSADGQPNSCRSDGSCTTEGPVNGPALVNPVSMDLAESFMVRTVVKPETNDTEVQCRTTGVLGECEPLCAAYYHGSECDDACHLEPCQVVAQQQLRGCLGELKINKTDWMGVLNTSINVMSHYVFADLAFNYTMGPLDTHADILSDLINMQSRMMNDGKNDPASANDFYGSIVRRFERLKDAHTQFARPDSFTNMFYLMPFQLISYVDKPHSAVDWVALAKARDAGTGAHTGADADADAGADAGAGAGAGGAARADMVNRAVHGGGHEQQEMHQKHSELEQVIRIGGVLTRSPILSGVEEALQYDHFNGSVADMSSMRVIRINDMPAVTAIRKWADEYVGVSKDPGTRFNLAVDRHYMLRSLAVEEVPDTHMKFDLLDDSSLDPSDWHLLDPVVVPWLGFSTKHVINREHLSAEGVVSAGSVGHDHEDDGQFVRQSSPAHQPGGAQQLWHRLRSIGWTNTDIADELGGTVAAQSDVARSVLAGDKASIRHPSRRSEVLSETWWREREERRDRYERRRVDWFAARPSARELLGENAFGETWHPGRLPDGHPIRVEWERDMADRSMETIVESAETSAPARAAAVAAAAATEASPSDDRRGHQRRGGVPLMARNDSMEVVPPDGQPDQESEAPLSEMELRPLMLTDDNSVEFWRLSRRGEKVGGMGFLRIRTFDPELVESFRYGVMTGLIMAEDMGLLDLVIDLRGNVGGSICLGYSVLHYLWPKFSPYGAYDFRQNPLGMAMAEAAAKRAGHTPVSMFDPTLWSDVFTDEPHTDASWYTDPISRTRGGRRHNYTQLVHDQCQQSFDKWIRPRHYDYDPERILLLTDGMCGATCAVFVDRLAEMFDVRTVTVGGVHGDPMSAASFPGGDALHLRDLLREVDILDLEDHQNAPKPLTVTASMSVTVREVYSWATGHEQTPLEFVWRPSHFRLPYSLSTALEHMGFSSSGGDQFLYYEVAELFEWCNGNETRACPIEHGRGINRCLPTGFFEDSYSACHRVKCDPGFIAHGRSSCVERRLVVADTQLLAVSIFLFVLGVLLACCSCGLLYRKGVLEDMKRTQRPFRYRREIELDSHAIDDDDDDDDY